MLNRILHIKIVGLLILLCLPASIFAQDMLMENVREARNFQTELTYFGSGGRFLGGFGELTKGLVESNVAVREHPVTGNIFRGELSINGLQSGGGLTSITLKEFDGTTGKLINSFLIGGSQPIDILPTNFQLHATTGNVLIITFDPIIVIGFRGGAPILGSKIAEYSWQTGEFVREYRDPFGAGFAESLMPQFHPQTKELLIFNRNRQLLRFSANSTSFLGVVFQVAEDVIQNNPIPRWRIHPNTGNIWFEFCDLGGTSICALDSATGQVVSRIPKVDEYFEKFNTFKSVFEINPVTGDLIMGVGTSSIPPKESFPSRVWVIDTTTGQVKGELGETRNFTWHVQKILFLTHAKAKPDLIVQPDFNMFTRSGWKLLSGTAKPEVVVYRLINRSKTSLNYSITQSANWMDADRRTGTLKPGERKLVRFTFNNNQQSLGVGGHTNTITFSNQTQGVVTEKKYTLHVGKDTFDRISLSKTSLNVTCSEDKCSAPSGQNYDLDLSILGAPLEFNTSASTNWFIDSFNFFISSEITSSPKVGRFNITDRYQSIDRETQDSTGYLIISEKNTGELLGMVTVTLNLPPPFMPNAATDPSAQVITPFWQAGAGTYSFIAISHPSLQGMSSQIGVRATPILESGFTSPSFLMQEFTISAGETKGYFLVPPGNNNPAFFIEGKGTKEVARLPSESTGSLRFEPIASNPKVPDANGNYNDITMLSYWGAVVFEGGNTGFALEFIGDLGDSASHPSMQPGRLATGVN